MASCIREGAADAEARLFPLPPGVDFWLQPAEDLEQADDETLASQAQAALEWLKQALKAMYKSAKIKSAVGDLFNVADFTHNLGVFGVFDELRSFAQEAANEFGLDMKAFFESAGLAKSLGEFRSSAVRNPPVLRQDHPDVGVPGVLRQPRRTQIQHENVALHVLILVARAVNPGFQNILQALAEKHNGRHRGAPTKGHARMMNKAVSRDDHRFKTPPVVMHNIDVVRCAVTFDKVVELKDMLVDLENAFGPPARDKNMFAFDDAEAAAQLHYRTFMRNLIYAPEGLTYKKLAKQNDAAWEKYLESPPEDPNEPWSRFRADATRAVQFLRSQEIANLPVRLICEVQCLLQEYLDGRLKMHNLYKVLRAPDEHSLYSDFKRSRRGLAESTTWTTVQQRAVDEVRARLEGQGIAVDSSLNDHGMTMLHSMADKGRVRAVQWLLEQRADANAITTDDGATPLYLATENSHSDVVSALLVGNAAVDRSTTSDGATALSAAASHGDIDAAQLLLQHRASANTTTRKGLTPLWRAALNGHKDVVQALLAAAADVNKARTGDSCTPLFVSAQSGYADVVAELLSAAADVHAAKADGGVTPLNVVAFRGHVDILEQLLRGRADVDEATNDGKTPLYVAAENGHTHVVEALLAKHPLVNKATTDDGTPPLYVAAQNGHVGVVQALLAAEGTNVNQATTNDGATPLWVAAESGHLGVVSALLDKGAEPCRALTTDKSTPLFMAAYCGHAEVVRLLLERKADHKKKCGLFGTALDGACGRGHAKVVDLLK